MPGSNAKATKQPMNAPGFIAPGMFKIGDPSRTIDLSKLAEFGFKLPISCDKSLIDLARHGFIRVWPNSVIDWAWWNWRNEQPEGDKSRALIT
jgi:hypothetical protein